MSEDITGATDFDVADVLSKLEAAEKKAKVDKDTVCFGLKQQDGGIVQVYVKKEQGEEFEQALSQMLAGSDNNKDNENTSMEIAEVLFKLKDRYDIVDVDWGDIGEDEEQEQTVGGEVGQPGAEGEPGAEGGENPIDQAAGAEGAESEPAGSEPAGSARRLGLAGRRTSWIATARLVSVRATGQASAESERAESTEPASATPAPAVAAQEARAGSREWSVQQRTGSGRR